MEPEALPPLVAVCRRAVSIPMAQYTGFESPLNGQTAALSLAHELSGLGSTRVVRFSASGWRRINEPGDVATGSAHAEVSGRFEPMGTAGTIDGGGGGAFGNVGTPVPTIPGAI